VHTYLAHYYEGRVHVTRSSRQLKHFTSLSIFYKWMLRVQFFTIYDSTYHQNIVFENVLAFNNWFYKRLKETRFYHWITEVRLFYPNSNHFHSDCYCLHILYAYRNQILGCFISTSSHFPYFRLTCQFKIVFMLCLFNFICSRHNSLHCAGVPLNIK